MSRANNARSLQKASVPDGKVANKKPSSEKIRAISISVIVVGIVVTLVIMTANVWAPAALAQSRSEHLQSMEQQVGIVNDQAFPLVIADSMSSSQSISGAFILFAGSITSQTQDNIKMGYKAPNGDSYILSVPVKLVVFHQVATSTPSGMFSFADWRSDLTLQDNIDVLLNKRWASVPDSRITINLTPEQFEQLVKG